MALVDSLDEQQVLERILDDAKPPVPAGARKLHWLLFTPFRYPPPPGGSRFRGPNDPGVFYGADEVRTACAELGYWRWRHLNESPALTAMPVKPQTVFRAQLATLAVDLRRPPFDVARGQWTDRDDYAACQAFARAAREAASARSATSRCAIRSTRPVARCSRRRRSRGRARRNSRRGCCR
jgi:hypothetical protein